MNKQQLSFEATYPKPSGVEYRVWSNVWAYRESNGAASYPYQLQWETWQKAQATIGNVYPVTRLCLHSQVGTVDIPEGTLRFGVTEPLRTPRVLHPDGREWSMGWKELIMIADEAFKL